MFSFSETIYYIFFGCALILSFLTSETYFRGILFIRILLIAGLVTELFVDWIDYFEENSFWVYFIYIPFEFITLSLFFRNSVSAKWLKKAILIAIPIYIIFIIYISNSYYSIEDYPGIIYNGGAIFLVLWSSLNLLTLEVSSGMRLFDLPIFWFCTAIAIFYSGIFFYNVVYNYLVIEETDLAQKLRLLVNLNLNYLLYALITYSMICSIRLKKSSIR